VLELVTEMEFVDLVLVTEMVLVPEMVLVTEMELVGGLHKFEWNYFVGNQGPECNCLNIRGEEGNLLQQGTCNCKRNILQ